MGPDEVSVTAISAGEPPLAGDEKLRATLGGYVAAAVPQFYQLVPIETEQLHRILGDAIGKAGSEFEKAFIAGAADKPAGIVTSLPLERLHAAQQASTIMLMRAVEPKNLGAFRTAVGEYSGRVEPIEGSGDYLSRVTVAPHARGQGFGRLLVNHILSLAEGDVWLHVAADNRDAIRTYEKLGFEFASDGPYESRAMVRRK
jgi:ribosomal protein S18 acetylase RimI-like enzyme